MTSTFRGMAPAADSARCPAPGPRPGLRLIVFAALLAVLLAGLGALLAWRNYRWERARIIEQTAGIARATAAETDRLLRDRIDLYQTVAAAPEVRTGDPVAMEIYFTFLAERQESLKTVGWVDINGIRRASASPDPPGGRISVADRDYFQRVLRDGKPYVGAALIDRTTNEPAVPIAVPTFDSQGMINGVFGAGLALTQLERQLDDSRIGDIAVHVVDRADQLIADGDPGGSMRAPAKPELIAHARRSGFGYIVGATNLVGEDGQLLAFAPVPTGDWVLFVTRSESEAFAAARRTFRTEVGALLTVALAGLAAAVWTGRQIDRLSQAERQALAESEALARENERLYHEATDAIKIRDEVLSSVSHDLKTPITVIRAQAQLLARVARRLSGPEAETLTGGLATIDSSTRRMTAMIGELLDLVRLQAGQPLDLRPEPVEIVALVRARAEAIVAGTGEDRIAVTADVDAITGNWDTTRLERVVDNLLSNAIKYSPDGGPVQVRVTADGDDGVLLTVEDRGIGIPAADLPHVFERFHRASNVGTIEGSGIGLAGARQIIEQHGGSISIESREGEGTRVTVRLPLGEPAPDFEPEEATSSVP